MFLHTITLFNVKRNSLTKLDEYKKTVLEGVHWEDINSVKGTDSIETDNTTKVVIPASVDGFLLPEIYSLQNDVDNYWTLKENDFIVKGEITYDITSVKDLENTSEVRTIKGYSIVDYGMNSYLNNYTVNAK